MNAIKNIISFGWKTTVETIDDRLDRYSPVCLMAVTAIGVYTLSKYSDYYYSFAKRKSLADYAGRWIAGLPFIRYKLQQQIQKEFEQFRIEVSRMWKPFGKPYTKIPEKGLGEYELLKLIDSYVEKTMAPLVNQQMSGTVYSNSLTTNPPDYPIYEFPEELTYRPPTDFQKVFTYAFQRTYLFNSLHTKEFSVGSFIKYQIVQMVSHSHGGHKHEAMGFVTRGGTESNMIVVRAMGNWGKEKGIKIGERVIIAPDSVHASIMKAGEAYGIHVVLIPTNRKGEVDMNRIQEAAQFYKDSLVGLVCSTPSYAKGAIDPVVKFAKIARNQGVALHVDCCLGGFVQEYVHNTKFLAIDGVTSLSVDTHKNGCAPKGSSVLVTKKLPNQNNLAYYAFYAIPGWTGGVYGTPSDAGSEPVTGALQALLAIVGIGEQGYREKATRIRESTLQLASTIRETEGLKLIREPDLHVITFEIDPIKGWREGAIYELAHQLEIRGFTFNALLDEALHFCVTDRFASDKTAIDRLKQAFKEALIAVKTLNETCHIFAKARMYCSLRKALAPDLKDHSLADYVKNSLLGSQAAEAIVKQFYCALANPQHAL